MTSRTRHAAFCTIRERTAALADRFDLTLAVADLDHIAPLFLPACQRMQDARQGLPGAQAYDAPSVGGSGAEKLTQPERLADQLDRTHQDRALLDTLLHDLTSLTDPAGIVVDPQEYARTLTVKTLSLRNLITAWSPHRPTPKDQRDVTAENDGVWCDHHATARIDEPAEHYGTVSNNLSLPMHLCGYCYWQVRRKGRLPTGEAMVKRHRTGKDEKEKVG